MSRENPYVRLKRITLEYVRGVEYRRVRHLMTVNSLSQPMEQVRQRSLAAQSLGWEVIVTPTENGLQFDYREKTPAVPWEIQP